MFKNIALVVLLFGCGGDDASTTASGTLAATGATAAAGTVSFSSADGGVSVTVTMTAGPAGEHGLHIHQEPACGNAGMDAGGHWDGTATAGDATTHGLPDGTTHHLGDLGNITIAADGTGTKTTSNSGWKLGDGSLTDVVGHSVIFHAAVDDGTMPSAGARLACAIIAAD
jgi:Cu-Zn family superoxide dismutase